MIRFSAFPPKFVADGRRSDHRRFASSAFPRHPPSADELPEPEPPPCKVDEHACRLVLHVAPSPWHQHVESPVHQPGSPVFARTHTCGVTAPLQTSPPQAMPPPTQSVSTMQVGGGMGPPPPSEAPPLEL